MSGNWFSTGFSSAVKQEQDRENANTWLPDRFWIPAGQSREIVLIDEHAAAFREHNAKINGSWKNWLTCAAPLMEAGEVAPCCSILGGDSAYSVSMVTIIDCTKWTDKKGNTRQFELKVLPAKYKTAQKLLRKQEDLAKDGKSLVGRLYKVTRETDKSPAVGDDYEFVREVDMNKLFDLAVYRGKKLTELFDTANVDEAGFQKLARTFSVMKGPDGKVPRKLVPFNYLKLYAPKTPNEIKALLQGYTPSDDDRGGNSGGSKGADENVPF